MSTFIAPASNSVICGPGSLKEMSDTGWSPLRSLGTLSPLLNSADATPTRFCADIPHRKEFARCRGYSVRNPS